MKGKILLLAVCLAIASKSQEIVCTLNSSSPFDCNSPSNICPNATTTIIAAPDTNYQCLQPLILSAYNFNISGSYSALEIKGSQIYVMNVIVFSDFNISTNQSLNISESVTVTGSLLIKSHNNSFQPSPFVGPIDYGNITTIITSCNLTASKLIIIGMQNIRIHLSTIDLTFTICLYQSINVNSLSNNITKYVQEMNVHAISQLNFSLFVFASIKIGFKSSIVTGVSIMALTLGNITISGSILNTTARSCRTNTGFGRGATIQYQNTYCTSGSSSCGYGTLSNTVLCTNIVQYFLFLSHSFPYISKGPQLSTGSGGYGYSPTKTQNGAGGGIIFILADKTAKIDNSTIEASGGDVAPQNFLSAGSGGTIFITSQTLLSYNQSDIKAMGGNSYNNNGSGGGGLIKISYQSAPLDIGANNLKINISQGYQNNASGNLTSSTGIFYGPICNPGTYVSYLSCLKCGPLSYSSLGDPVCRPCPNISELSFNNNNDSQYSFVSDCYQQKQNVAITEWITPGDITLLSISLYLAFLIIFTIIGAVLKKKIKKEKLSSNEDFKIEDVKKDIDKAKILALELRKSKQVKSYELMYHVHRISCFGNNNDDSPWILPETVPEDIKKYVHCQVFRNFAQSFNQEAKWTKTQYWITKISLIIYPLYWYYLDLVKKRKFKALLQKLQHAKDYNLLKNHGYEDRSIITIKFSKNKDYTNCYLDFFVYQRADIRYFTLSSPFLLYLSGQGNFLRPFYLQEGDVFFRMMFFVINRNITKLQENADQKSQLFNNMVSQKKRQKSSQQLNKFLRKLNTLACTLDLSSPTSVIVDVLWKLVQFIDGWNRQLFNIMAVQVDLLLMISRIYGGNHIGNDVQVLTSKNREVFEANILKKLEQYNRYEHTIKIALFVYNPQQQIPREQEPEIQLRAHLESSQDDEESLKEMLLDRRTYTLQEGKGMKWWMRAGSMLSRLRYYMLSHQNTHFDEYTIKFMQSLFILMQTMLVFIWSIKLQLPYVFINLVCPFIGIIWFVSDSYGFGKLYLIFNAMALLDELMALFVYTIIQRELSSNSEAFIRNIICSSVNSVIILVMMLIGKRAITLSKKLSLKKQEESLSKKQ